MTIVLARPWFLAVLASLAPFAAAQDEPASRPDPRPATRPTAEPADDADGAMTPPVVEPSEEERGPRDDDRRRRRRRHRGQGGNVSMGKPVVVEAGEENRDDIVVMGSHVRIDGRQNGDVVVLGGNAKIAGEVEGDVVVIGGVLDLVGSARIDGDAVAIGGGMRRETGATIMGQKVDMGGLGFLPALIPDWSWGFGMGSIFLMSIFAWLKTAAAALLLAVLIAAVMPARVDAASVVLRDRWLESFGWGFLTFAVCVLITPVLCLTCIGAVIPFLFYQVAKYFGMAALFVVVGQALGRAGLARELAPLPSLLMGFLVLSLLGLLMPFMWWIYGFIAVGCAMITKFGAMRPWFPGSVPPPPPPLPVTSTGDAAV